MDFETMYFDSIENVEPRDFIGVPFSMTQDDDTLTGDDVVEVYYTTEGTDDTVFVKGYSHSTGDEVEFQIPWDYDISILGVA